MHTFLPNSLISIHPVHSAARLRNGRLRFGIVGLSRGHGGIIIDHHTIVRTRGSTRHRRLLGGLRRNVRVRNVIGGLASCNTFISLNNVSNLLRVASVT